MYCGDERKVGDEGAKSVTRTAFIKFNRKELFPNELSSGL